MAQRRSGGHPSLTIEVVTQFNHIEYNSLMLLNTGQQLARWGAEKIAERMKASMGRGPSASSPGQAPNIQSGDLYGSIRPREISPLNWGVEMSEIGELLDNGTPSIAPRPFIMPAVEQTRNDIESEARKLIQRNFRSG